ncbi:uncharacterized protein VTP21DRAFT_107 [Calcarisporiella thermophila]|uniref:uncharacterized protein n=1 Tax=Calcarisporiella thermophila TaxID=911321 RepID=UPI0037433C1A
MTISASLPNKWKFWKSHSTEGAFTNTPLRCSHGAQARKSHRTHALNSDKMKVPSSLPLVRNIFGAPLIESINYACKPVSFLKDREEICGQIPIVVAQCVNVEGIFRVSGSAKRISVLQELFESHHTGYGNDINWMGYSVHDASSVLRRFCNLLPEPVITHEYYKAFRETMEKDISDEERIKEFQVLIEQLPQPHQYLLFYLLDLLAFFAKNSCHNRMNASNLASIFQPGMLSHPECITPTEYRLSQQALTFLIQHQASLSIPRETRFLGDPLPSPTTPLLNSVIAASFLTPASSNPPPSSSYSSSTLTPPAQIRRASLSVGHFHSKVRAHLISPEQPARECFRKSFEMEFELFNPENSRRIWNPKPIEDA